MSQVQKSTKLGGGKTLLTADLNVLIPGTATPSGWIVTFAGPSHPKTVALSDQAERDRQKKSAEIERAQVNNRKWKGDELTPAEIRQKTVEGVIGRIISWTPVDFGEGDVDFAEGDAAAEARAVKLFLDPAMGQFFGQFVDFLTAEKAFLKASATG